WLAIAGSVTSATGASCSVLTGSARPSMAPMAGVTPDGCVPATAAVPNCPRPCPNWDCPCPNWDGAVVTARPEPPTPCCCCGCRGVVLGTAPSEAPSGTGELGGATPTYTPAVGTTATAGTSVPATVMATSSKPNWMKPRGSSSRGRFHTSTSSSV